MARRLLLALLWILALPARAAWIDGGATLTAEAGERAIVGCTAASEDCRAQFVDETAVAAIGAPGAGLTVLFTVAGELYKRDTGDPTAYQFLTSKDRDNDWDVIVDLTGKAASAAQDEFYTAIESVIAEPNCSTMEALLPFRVKVIGVYDDGGDDECDFAEATDWDAANPTGRSCLAVFRSAPYASGRPVPHGGNGACTGAGAPYACCTGPDTGTCVANCILRPGGLVFDVSEASMKINETGATEPMSGFMWGAGTYAGFSDGSGGGYNGILYGLTVIGPASTQDTADVDSDWAGADQDDEIPSLHFSIAADSSTTTVIHNWVNGNPGITILGMGDCDSNTNTDIDDWCFATNVSFSSYFERLHATGMNCGLFGVGSNLSVNQVECTGSGGIPPFGITVGDQTDWRAPVSSNCASGFCTSAQFSSSFSLSDAIVQAYMTAGLYLGGGTHAAVLNLYEESNWVGDCTGAGAPYGCCTGVATGPTCSQYQYLLGSGRCSSDNSTCALDSECPSGTCDRAVINCEIDVALENVRGVLRNLSLGPCARDPYASMGDERQYGLVITGNTNSDVNVVINSVANIAVDLSGLSSASPLLWPASYPGLFVPQVQTIYANNATESLACQAEMQGQFNQVCINRGVTPHTSWFCDPDNAGVSPFLCDNSADWIQIGGAGGGSTNAFGTIDTPTGTDPIADAAPDTLQLTCSNGLTCPGTAATDLVAFGISAGGLADSLMATSYSGTGTCAGSQWARVLNDAAAPTCSQPNFTDFLGTIAQAQIPAGLRVPLAQDIDLGTPDGDPDVFDVADGVGPICTAGRGPCLCFKAPADSSGTQRACVLANGAWFSGDAEATTAGNFLGSLDNDAAAGSMACKNKSAAGEWQVRDVDQAAADRNGVCEGNVEVGTISDRRTVVNKTATGNVGDPGTADGNEYEANDSIITNSGAGGAVVLTLPVAQIGQCITFYHVTAGNMDVNPNGTERILGLTDANGDAIRSTAVGNSIEVCAISQAAGSQWAVLQRVGSWADVN